MNAIHKPAFEDNNGWLAHAASLQAILIIIIMIIMIMISSGNSIATQEGQKEAQRNCTV